MSHPKGPRPKHVGGLNGQWRHRKRDKPVICGTVEQRIRSGGKSEGCTVREANAPEPRNPSEMLRGTSLPAVKQEYRSQPSPAQAASRERRAIRLGIETKPSPCSNRGSDWTDRRAWYRSTSCPAGLASSRTCSPQIAGPKRRPRPKDTSSLGLQTLFLLANPLRAFALRVELFLRTELV